MDKQSRLYYGDNLLWLRAGGLPHRELKWESPVDFGGAK